MTTIFKTADGVCFEDYKKAREHEEALIGCKLKDLRFLKEKALPRAQREYNTAKANLKQFLQNRNTILKKLSKQEFHYQLGNLEVTLGNDLRYLKCKIIEYKKLKIELSALSKPAKGGTNG